MGGLSKDLRAYVVMLIPPFRDRGPQPAVEGDRVGASILARTSVGAAFWKLQSRESGTVLQHCWGRYIPSAGESVLALVRETVLQPGRSRSLGQRQAGAIC